MAFTSLRVPEIDEKRGGGRGRRADDFTDTSSMPWQVRAIGMIGVPSVALLGVLYYVIPNVAAMPKVEESLKVHHQTMEKHQEEQHEHATRMENYMRQVCVSLAVLAKSPQAQQNCLTVR